MNHRFLHGNSRGANGKFRVHFNSDDVADHRRIDALMASLWLSLQDPIFSELNELYDREHGIEVVTARGSQDLPDLPGGGHAVIDYEFKTTAIVSQEEVQLLVDQGIVRALWALSMATLGLAAGVFEGDPTDVLVVDLRATQEPSAEELVRRLFGDGQSRGGRIVL